MISGNSKTDYVQKAWEDLILKVTLISCDHADFAALCNRLLPATLATLEVILVKCLHLSVCMRGRRTACVCVCARVCVCAGTPLKWSERQLKEIYAQKPLLAFGNDFAYSLLYLLH